VEISQQEGLQEEGFGDRTREISKEKIEQAAEQARAIADTLTQRLKPRSTVSSAERHPGRCAK